MRFGDFGDSYLGEQVDRNELVSHPGGPALRIWPKDFNLAKAGV